LQIKNDRKVRILAESKLNHLTKVCPDCKKIVFNAGISDAESKKQFDAHLKEKHEEIYNTLDFENLQFGTYRDEIQKIVESYLPLNCGFLKFTTEQSNEIFTDFLTYWYYENAPSFLARSKVFLSM